MSWSINDVDVVLGGLELQESNIDGDSSLALSLQFVENPGILEGSLREKRALNHCHVKFIYRTYISKFLRLLLEPLYGSLVDTSAVVDQVTSGGGLARVDMADNNNVNVGLFLSHIRSSLRHNSEIISY